MLAYTGLDDGARAPALMLAATMIGIGAVRRAITGPAGGIGLMALDRRTGLSNAGRR